uniref:Innexin n=1 Tax=Rhodnius prolixus TaxID=13249 RepID=T1ICS8_RHOPR
MFVFGNFKQKANIGPKNIYTDNFVFRLHYRITFWFLLACAVLVGSREFIREHINCISNGYLAHVIDTYCFFSTTFTVVKYHNSSLHSGTSAHPGVGPYLEGKDPIIRHAYYQWVPFVLFFQGLFFYGPYLLWSSVDNNRMKAIVQIMTTSRLTAPQQCEINGHKIESEEARNKKVMWMKEAYLSFILCEALNWINIIIQIILVNIFLQGKFLHLGIDWVNNSENILDMVFPKVTKCTFRKFGSSGSVQVHDTICVMALNIINEKIYCLLWFWFLILFIITSLGLLWRLLTYLLHRRSPAFNKWIWGELSPGPALRRQDIQIVTRKLCFSDWLFLYYLGKNINGSMFRTLVAQISESLQDTSVPQQEKFLL